MRKNIVPRESRSEAGNEQGWLELGKLAQVEITSEQASHPIESALLPGGGSGWRAAEPGPQVVRLLFDQPQKIKRLYLLINEDERARTQEFVLRWSGDGRSFQEIVRQQYNFNPPGTTSEEEEYTVDLSGLTTLELEITPDIGGSGARASLARLRLA